MYPARVEETPSLFLKGRGLGLEPHPGAPVSFWPPQFSLRREAGTLEQVSN